MEAASLPGSAFGADASEDVESGVPAPLLESACAADASEDVANALPSKIKLVGDKIRGRKEELVKGNVGPWLNDDAQILAWATEIKSLIAQFNDARRKYEATSALPEECEVKGAGYDSCQPALAVCGTKLHRAAYSADLHSVVELCARGSEDDLEETNDTFKQTPLHVACSRGHVAVAQLLLAARAAPEARDKDGLTALNIVMGKGKGVKAAGSTQSGGTKRGTDLRYDELEKLLQARITGGPEPAADMYGTALHKAAYAGDVANAAVLCAKGSGLEARNDSFKQTPLHVASSRGHREVVQLLLAAKADAQATDKDNLTAWKIASMQGHQIAAPSWLQAKTKPFAVSFK